MDLHEQVQLERQILRNKVTALKKQMLAQQVCLKQMCTHLRELHKWEQGSPLEAIIGKALALQPDLSALREHDVEVILKFAKWTGPIRADIAAFRYIERIRKGEA